MAGVPYPAGGADCTCGTSTRCVYAEVYGASAQGTIRVLWYTTREWLVEVPVKSTAEEIKQAIHDKYGDKFKVTSVSLEKFASVYYVEGTITPELELCWAQDAVARKRMHQTSIPNYYRETLREHFPEGPQADDTNPPRPVVICAKTGRPIKWVSPYADLGHVTCHLRQDLGSAWDITRVERSPDGKRFTVYRSPKAEITSAVFKG